MVQIGLLFSWNFVAVSKFMATLKWNQPWVFNEGENVQIFSHSGNFKNLGSFKCVKCINQWTLYFIGNPQRDSLPSPLQLWKKLLDLFDFPKFINNQHCIRFSIHETGQKKSSDIHAMGKNIWSTNFTVFLLI